MSNPNITRQSFSRRSLHLSYLDSAPADATRQAVLLLHGFPDAADMWQPIIPALHRAGFRVLAPDIVGCGQSDVAATRQDYDAFEILNDLTALLDHVGVSHAKVVGHDWGAVLAWFLAMHRPQRVESLSVISVGHLAAYVRAGLRQKLMGWYILYFHLAGLADRLLLGRGPLSLRQIFGSHPEIESVMSRFTEPGRLTAALRIYRANIFQHILFSRHPKVRCPVLGVYSANDAFLDDGQMRDSARWVDGRFHFVALTGGHWVPLDQPERLTGLLLKHFASDHG